MNGKKTLIYNNNNKNKTVRTKTKKINRLTTFKVNDLWTKIGQVDKHSIHISMETPAKAPAILTWNLHLEKLLILITAFFQSESEGGERVADRRE